MDIFECSICDNRYDAAQHRPRSLPCGHGFCTLCIESCITRGNKSCPVCRVGHGANSADELPVSFLLEELIHKATISTSQKHESDQVPEKESIDLCPKHLGVPIHFQCKTHNVKVCHSCTVLEHNPSSCNLLSLDDLMKEKQEAHIITVQKQMDSIKNTEKDLKALHQNNIDDVNEEERKKQRLEKEVELLLTKIEQSNQEILKKGKPQEQIQDAIQSCKKNHKALELMENMLRAASNNKIITQQCQLSTNEIGKSQKWEETLRKELNLNVEAELNLTSASTIVFLDLSAQGCNLGRVYVRILANKPRGQQFVMLALGTNGATLKGAHFENKHVNRLSLLNYVTESKSKAYDILLPMESEVKNNISRGSIYEWNPNIAGFQIKTSLECTQVTGYFGDIIAGLEVIDRAVSNEFAIADIMISECGIVLGY